MPAEGVDLTAKSQLLSTDEIVTLAGIFVEEGVTKVSFSCISLMCRLRDL
jgi:molybdenum cofactor biosynthesis enzyme MoaA